MACLRLVNTTKRPVVASYQAKTTVPSVRRRERRVRASNPEPEVDPGCPDSETGLCDRPSDQEDATKVETVHGVAKILGENSVTYVFRPEQKPKGEVDAKAHTPGPEDEKLGCIDSETGLCE
eukprot:jgi/Pico_ML_1/51623/g2617.t1